MNYRVVFQPQALLDLEDQYRYIARDNSLAADRWFNRFVAAIEAIADSPKRYSLAREGQLIGREIRQLLFGKRRGVRRVLFLIESDTVRVLCIRHIAQRDMSADELLGGL
jgi:plasmid stabilization system protein ParE